ncbi:GntR family transcriptional regulator [Desulfitobacterium metallireducens]|uniref:GntR family transcriptional regulator n=1 Tax=Desulfitobacterium metallireducens DSM 15288 TaxID=871968 RepID=W0E7N0_9FIRM|nr:GntR family transcriptional regulator [Desulfitobacterium metallireducens]AHF06865.1 GntR family transcriptional regulator [Desulfitobacterium metallireducens DSM 15288]
MKILISNSSSDPIYQQIFNQIQQAIFKGELKEGEALPSIRNLAKELQISVITTKRAYDDLEQDHFIETVPGKGSFIGIQNKELMREKHLRILKDQLIEGIQTAKLLGIHLDELQKMLTLLYKEE